MRLAVSLSYCSCVHLSAVYLCKTIINHDESRVMMSRPWLMRRACLHAWTAPSGASAPAMPAARRWSYRSGAGKRILSAPAADSADTRTSCGLCTCGWRCASSCFGSSHACSVLSQAACACQHNMTAASDGLLHAPLICHACLPCCRACLCACRGCECCSLHKAAHDAAQSSLSRTTYRGLAYNAELCAERR